MKKKKFWNTVKDIILFGLKVFVVLKTRRIAKRNMKDTDNTA